MKKVILILIFTILLSALGCVLFDHPSGYPRLKNVAWKKKNIIIVLGMRTERSGDKVILPEFAQPRVTEAERLYRDCKATRKICLILASGGDPANNGVTEAALIKKELEEDKVPATDILTEENSVSTYHNAKDSSKILEKEAPDLTVLVTSDVHLLRALRMFRLFHVRPLPAPADVP